MPKLHSVLNDGNRYCGPAAISAISGISTGEAAKLIREIRGKKMVTGTWISDLSPVLELLGYQANLEIIPIKSFTLNHWLEQTKEQRVEGRLFLISAGNHWQVIEGNQYVCGKTILPISVTNPFVPKKAKVTGIWEITNGQVPDHAKVAELLARGLPTVEEIQKRDSDRKLMKQAKALAKKHGIEIDPHDNPGEWWVYPPDGCPDEADCFYEEGHLAIGVQEVWERVSEYAKMFPEIEEEEK